MYVIFYLVPGGISSSTSTGSTSTVGASSVTSSGYMSPSIITLDSPSPPGTRNTTPVPQLSPIRMPPPMFPANLFIPSMQSVLEVDSDSNSPQPGSNNQLYHF